MPGRTFSREFKLSLVKAIANGDKTNTQVYREHQIDQSVLTRWKREYRDRGDAAFTPSFQEQLQGEVEVLQATIAELEGFIGQHLTKCPCCPFRGTLRVKKAFQKLPSKNAAT